jgi:hypothetical protein
MTLKNAGNSGKSLQSVDVLSEMDGQKGAEVMSERLLGHLRVVA